MKPPAQIKELKRKLANAEEALDRNERYYAGVKNENETLRALILEALSKALNNQEKHI